MKTTQTTLVLGGNGKTGRRVVDQLIKRGMPVRVGSRTGDPAFNWEDPSTWPAVLEGVGAVYIAYYPDLAVPGAVETIQAFTNLALSVHARRLVLLSGRGEEEAQKAEQILQDSSANWTILRCSWFAQNFSENFLQESILNDEVVLPVGDVGEPFVDADDIADVAVAALTDDRHIGHLYELTGPRLLTFAEAVGEISKSTGRDIGYVQVSAEAYATALEQAGLPADFQWLINYLFNTVLDGRNATLANGVQQALSRPPRDFSDYVATTTKSGVWDPVPA
jgi:uncharacterized protein YbjT (DUF2867 family)